jgi:raffinose/stachyose/melibiose transport system permease protein
MKLTKKSNWLQALYFLGPAIVFFATMKIAPFILGMYYALTDWNGISDTKNFVGLKNFLFLLDDDNFINSFNFTARYTVVIVVLTNLIAFSLAFLLTRKLKSRNIVRTVVFTPNVIGGILLGFIWQFIFVQGFPAIGKATGIGFFELPWLGTAATGFWGVIMVGVWQFAGYIMIIYIAGITSVPYELLEAAEIDGAGTLRKIMSVVIPLILPVVTVCVFLTLSTSFKVFDVIFSLTKGGPFQSTETVAMDIYYEAYTRNNMGVGAAKAFVFFIAVALLSFIQVWFTNRKAVK